jgi:hypothetical protein
MSEEKTQPSTSDGAGEQPAPASPKPSASSSDSDAVMKMILPVGRSGWAIAAGYFGLFSVLCLPAPLALFTGVMALLDIKKNPDKGGKGRAIFGIVMGTIGTLSLGLWVMNMLIEGVSS